jgi:plastocyanin
MMNRTLLALLLPIAAIACGGQLQPDPSPGTVSAAAGAAPTDRAAGSGDAASPPGPQEADPREGGLDVGFGEWAIQLEADEIRPGPVTFVVRNGGTMPHGFEIESERDDESVKIETELFGPGESVRVQADLAPGVYKIECLVDGHDDLGMEALLVVSEDAPLVAPTQTRAGEVRIDGFAFAPTAIDVAVGTQVTWTNHDPAAHTVTADDGSFDSDVIDAGGTFSTRFATPGRFTYLCEIHPTMTGVVQVAS